MKNVSPKIGQLHFEFHEWKEVFQMWRNNIPIYGEENIQIVVSTHHGVSGYWIEAKGMEYSDGDRCYTGKAVLKLEERIKKEVALAEKENREPDFTL
jgi:hypothetical protein